MFTPTKLKSYIINLEFIHMKKISLYFLLALFIYSCGSNDQGELVGVKGKKWHPEKPYGMALVPGGAFIMGKSDDDLAGIKNAPTKTVTVRSFYMDETEITNSEYRQFVNWVRDSIVRMKLAVLADEVGMAPDDGGIGEFAFIGAGSVVTKNVPPYALVVGNPSKQIGWMSEYGHRLEFDKNGLAICPESEEQYELSNEDRDYLEPIGHNLIVKRRGFGITVFSNNTTYQRVRSALNNAHVRDNLSTIERDIENIVIFCQQTTQHIGQIRDLSFVESVQMPNHSLG